MAQARKEDEHHSLIITPTQTLHTTTCIQEKEVKKELNTATTDQSGNSAPSSSPSPLSSRALYLLGDLTSTSASRFAEWLLLARSRSGSCHYPRFRTYQDSKMPHSSGEQIVESASLPHPKQASEISLWERLGRASALDIDSREFSWDMLASIHHSEHTSSTEHSEDDLNKALEVTVNSGGVVFIALFHRSVNDDPYPKEAAAVIKIPSSRMATQSERLGYEFAKRLGVSTPQARVIHNCSEEWQLIKDAVEKKRDAAVIEGNEVVEVTCLELLEALELSRCLFLMKCKH